ncbi:YheC/YheD family protein [Alkalihalobacterium bogoriense]|uniref:YheC/YheD family protein n=1 Tax=Alkalihalobacterium bogoriense TaxID=246272 RepID=UPI00047C5503|nr:YheC/YheD family protein [Alkalihalobacterium bogoriense]
MIHLGILLTHLKQEEELVLSIAKKAADYDIHVFRFSPFHMVEENQIYGEQWINNCWVKVKINRLDFIYDRCFYPTQTFYEKYATRVLSFKKKVPFIGYGLPNKWVVYKALQKNASIIPYLPSTYLVEDWDIMKNTITKERSVIIKPIAGAQGKGIIILTKKDDRYFLKTTEQPSSLQTMSEEEGRKLCLDLKNQFIFQPLLPLIRNGSPLDLRIYLHKNKDGQWVEAAKAFRKGVQNHFVANLSQGATIVPFQNMKTMWSKENWQHLNAALANIIKTVPLQLESYFLPLFDLGIDVGIDHNGKAWILEVNSKPGRKILFRDLERKESYISTLLSYIQYLSHSNEFVQHKE